jgi:hydroxymethylpyrimidine pyrophosphatase-like HAD family hydrolase
MSLQFLKQEFGVNAEEAKNVCAFSGDSPNDEPMFEYFPQSYAVANIKNFMDQLNHKPTFIMKSEGGLGFTEVAAAILNKREGHLLKHPQSSKT